MGKGKGKKVKNKMQEASSKKLSPTFNKSGNSGKPVNLCFFSGNDKVNYSNSNTNKYKLK